MVEDAECQWDDQLQRCDHCSTDDYGTDDYGGSNHDCSTHDHNRADYDSRPDEHPNTYNITWKRDLSRCNGYGSSMMAQGAARLFGRFGASAEGCSQCIIC